MPDIITEIKVSRLRWIGRIQRMEENEIVKRIMESKPEGRRKIGRPKNRLMDGWSIAGH